MKARLTLALVRLGPRERGGLIVSAAGLGVAIGVMTSAFGGSRNVSTSTGLLTFVLVIGAALWWHRRMTERNFSPQYVSPSARIAWLPSTPSAILDASATTILGVLWVVAYFRWGVAGLVAASVVGVMALVLFRSLRLLLGEQAVAGARDIDRRRRDAVGGGLRRE